MADAAGATPAATGGEQAASAAHHGPVTDGPAPVPAEVRHHASDDGNVDDDGHHRSRDQSPQSKSIPISVKELSDFAQSIQPSGTDLEHYFVGPRDLGKHSKWPTVMRMHGSVLPRLILPLTIMAGWSTTITCVSILVHPLQVSNILLTVLGFVVGLALSFRSSTAYERFADGRNLWAQLIQTSRNMARTIWVNIDEREGELGKQDLLGKLTAFNLIHAFAVALKHTLRFEPDIGYKDLVGLVGHLDTFAKDAHDPEMLKTRRTPWKAAGEYLGVSFAESNPRKRIKTAKKPLGHLPLEILNHLSAYIDYCVKENTIPSALHQGQLIGYIATLNEVLTGAERVRDTPLPEAYNIAISQIAWIYIAVLPFQLTEPLGWLAIPGSIVAAYIILSLVAIGQELENPFGKDVNDLPLDLYCDQLASELEIISAAPPPKVEDFMPRSDNLVMYPLSFEGYDHWKNRSVDDIRGALRTRVVAHKQGRSAAQSQQSQSATEVSEGGSGTTMA
ncbi:hypothetical protein VTN31DRAFT_7237 [Thermomyces dupontii]|uniref:uncharacterized protein n=1 Tax=Talaromyces thermophilus TaxID=28565 RepID=UPI003743DBD8